MKYYYVIITVLILSIKPILAQKVAISDQSVMSDVVLLEKKDNGIYKAHGVGTIFHDEDDPLNLIIVTNEHVLRNPHIYVSFSIEDSMVRKLGLIEGKVISHKLARWQYSKRRLRIKVNLIENSTYVKHSINHIDIAAFRIPRPPFVVLKNDTLRIVQYGEVVFNEMQGRDIMYVGQDIFFLGFPFRLGTDEEVIPTLRKGAVAWKSPNSHVFLLDAFSYGGNSGSPIYTTSEIEMTRNFSRVMHYPRFVGIVKGHIEDHDGNVGLATCHYSDDVLYVIKKLKKIN